MKVNFESVVGKVRIDSMATGSTFLDKRRSKPDETGLYMIIDSNSKYSINYNGTVNKINTVVCVNLSNGQLKGYSPDTYVLPVNAEVNLID